MQKRKSIRKGIILTTLLMKKVFSSVVGRRRRSPLIRRVSPKVFIVKQMSSITCLKTVHPLNIIAERINTKYNTYSTVYMRSDSPAKCPLGWSDFWRNNWALAKLCQIIV